MILFFILFFYMDDWEDSTTTQTVQRVNKKTAQICAEQN